MVRQYQRGRARRARWFCRKALKIDRRLAVGFLGLTPALRARVVVAADAVSKKWRGCAAGCVEGLCFKGQGKGSEGGSGRSAAVFSLLPLEGRSPAEGFCAGLICEHSLHIKRTP